MGQTGSRQGKKNECSNSLGTKEASTTTFLLELAAGVSRSIQETNKESHLKEESQEGRRSAFAERAKNSLKLADCTSRRRYAIA